MAAIAGVWTQTGAHEAEAGLAHVLARLRQRSPDGQRTWAGEGVALGHGALHATPASLGECQPVVATGAVLVVDGRIDDRPALLGALGLHRDWHGSDADLFGLAWARWRHDLGHHVVGDFALAVWELHSRCLWLLRDRAGVRPLYWARTRGGVAFASQAEALLGLPGVAAEPDETHVLYVLAPQLGDGPLDASWYRDVRKLPAGHWLRLGPNGEQEQQPWWTPEPGPALQLGGFGEYREAFLEIFAEAVACRLVGTRSPGLLLSGGIDSAAILAMARRGAAGAATPLVPVSIEDASRGEACAETANIRALLDREPQAIRVPVPGFGGPAAARAMALAPWSPPHPVDNSVLLPLVAYRAAQAAGLNVMLDGIDGDQVMEAPDDYVGRMALSGHWGAAWREARQAHRHHTYLQQRSPARILLRGLLSPVAPGWVRMARLRLRQRRERQAPLGARLRHDLPGLGRLRADMERRDLAEVHALAKRSPHERLAYSWVHAGLFRGLEAYDHAAARFGIETRHPWCDQRLLDFFLRLPLEMKVGDGWTKRLARAASAPWLPPGVAWHSGKYHLGIPVMQASLSGLTRAEAGRLADDLVGPLAPWVAPDVLAVHAQRLRAGAPDYTTFELASLGAWIAWLQRGAATYDLG